MAGIKLDQETYEAIEAYHSIIKMLKRNEYVFEQNDENHTVRLTCQTEDLDINFLFEINKEQQLVQLLSFLPSRFPKEKHSDGVCATVFVNHFLTNGHFYYDLEGDLIYYKISNRYSFPQGMNTLLIKNDKIIEYMLKEAQETVAMYDHLFLLLANGDINLNDFINKVIE